MTALEGFLLTVVLIMFVGFVVAFVVVVHDTRSGPRSVDFDPVGESPCWYQSTKTTTRSFEPSDEDEDDDEGEPDDTNYDRGTEEYRLMLMVVGAARVWRHDPIAGAEYLHEALSAMDDEGD